MNGLRGSRNGPALSENRPRAHMRDPKRLEQMDAFDAVLQIIERAKPFGYRELANGTRLYGHAPHVAPEAWLHQVYAPLEVSDMDSLVEIIGLPIPGDLRHFFRLANGVGLFSGSLSIYGKRTSYVRTGDAAWQPFCIATANTLERPTHAKPTQLVVGSYRSDGSLLFLDLDNGAAFRTKSRSKKILNRWTDFWTMLKAEAQRLSGLFDATGRRCSEGPTTPAAEP